MLLKLIQKLKNTDTHTNKLKTHLNIHTQSYAHKHIHKHTNMNTDALHAHSSQMKEKGTQVLQKSETLFETLHPSVLRAS